MTVVQRWSAQYRVLQWQTRLRASRAGGVPWPWMKHRSHPLQEGENLNVMGRWEEIENLDNLWLIPVFAEETGVARPGRGIAAKHQDPRRQP